MDNNLNPPPNQSASKFFDLEDLIKNYIVRIGQLKDDLKKKREMLEDAFEGDAIYQEHALKAKEAAKIKGATKQQILKQEGMNIEIADDGMIVERLAANQKAQES